MPLLLPGQSLSSSVCGLWHCLVRNNYTVFLRLLIFQRMRSELIKNRGWIDCFFERHWLWFITTYCTLDSEFMIMYSKITELHGDSWNTNMSLLPLTLQFDVSHTSSKTNISSKWKKTLVTDSWKHVHWRLLLSQFACMLRKPNVIWEELYKFRCHSFSAILKPHYEQPYSRRIFWDLSEHQHVVFVQYWTCCLSFSSML